MAEFFSRLAGKNGAKHLIAIDLGSNTAIRSLLFDQAETTFIAKKKQYFELPVREDDSALITPISEHLRQLIFEYIKEAGKVPDHILIGLGSHFTFNEIATARVTRKHPREGINPSELHGILNDYLDKHRTAVIGPAPYALVHLMPFRITVDGYRVDVISDNTAGRELEISLFTTYALNSYWEALWRIKSLWGGIDLGFISDQDAIASALVSAMNVYDALIVKIGAKKTEVSILGEGVILFTGQFDVGGDNFTQAVARRLNIKREEALRIKEQLDTATLPAKTEQSANETLNSTASLWLAELAKLLKNQESFVLPKLVYLLGGGARLKAIEEAISTRPWYDELTFVKSIEVKRLEAQDFAAKIFRNTAVPLTGPEEVSLAALAMRLAINKKIIYRGRREKAIGDEVAADNLEKLAKP